MAPTAWRFAATGLAAAAVDYAVLLLLMSLGLDYTLAKAISWVIGTASAIGLNWRWTFRAEPSKWRATALWLLYLAAFLLQVGIFHLCYPWLLGLFGGWADGALAIWLAQTAGFLLAQIPTATGNYLVQRFVIFK
ncbi:MAG: GtrA family protein [Propionibacteriaceae bacterium]|nr:GtrA family protein [Propionibacteriaceae bacterium]